MKTHPMRLPVSRSRGFALVVTLALMVPLSILVLGMLSLSAVSLRGMSSHSSIDVARANARMAVMMALGELQRTAGDDRRITADGSIHAGAEHPHAVGVWKSWSPSLALSPGGTAPDYTTPKTASADPQSNQPGGFLRWLLSSTNPEQLRKADWAVAGSLPDPVTLFAEDTDGFGLVGGRIPVGGGSGSASAGAFAWAVSQAATRAKINVAGPERAQRAANNDLEVQPRPNLAITGMFNQPEGGWDGRASKVISMSQAYLDEEMWVEPDSRRGGAHFTTQGYGVLADVVNGGLKTDLNLGFEMSDTDFSAAKWGTVQNPFSGSSASSPPPTSYGTQRPLFLPLTQTGSVRVLTRTGANQVDHRFPAAAVPTFHTLRSFYRTPYHLYNTPSGITAFGRPADHVAAEAQVSQTGTAPHPSPGLGYAGQATQISLQPILDRAIFILSVALKPRGDGTADPRLLMTPVVTLWNPYNVALEIDAATLYLWRQLQYNNNWRVNDLVARTRSGGLTNAFRYQTPSGAEVNPYFLVHIGQNQAGPIRFEPGEVRLFTPASNDIVDYEGNDTPAKRKTLRLIPDGLLSVRGGLSVPVSEVDGGWQEGRMAPGDRVRVNISSNTPGTPFWVGLEDDSRLRNAGSRGRLIADVESATRNDSTVMSGNITYESLIHEPRPFAYIETHHRVGIDSSGADIVHTVNPRHAHTNRYLSQGTFVGTPHYQTGLKKLNTANDIGLECTPDGRSSFYGVSHSSMVGRTHLSFFEVPQSPILSLAALASLDAGATPFAPAYPFANSWASPFLPRSSSAKLVDPGSGGGDMTSRSSLPVYDHSYLLNEALWDAYYFSGAAPTIKHTSRSGSASVWNSPAANVTRSTNDVVSGFIDDPVGSPLKNPRMTLHLGNATSADLKADLARPEGCRIISGHLLMDGAFNVNSTSVEAWKAFMAGMRGQSFNVAGGSSPGVEETGFPRFRNPVGHANDNWHGFRTLTDDQIDALARNLVDAVRLRGPFLSLAEFVNRRVSGGDMGLKGAVQEAIDKTIINESAVLAQTGTSLYPEGGNISPSNMGVGIPGYLTQADVLKSLAPAMTVRSDTFTIRGYGEARNSSGKVTASVYCEAVVQRFPEFIDPGNSPSAAVADLNTTNRTFGRKFDVISFRYLHASEIGA
jgi:hypothetical protein